MVFLYQGGDSVAALLGYPLLRRVHQHPGHSPARNFRRYGQPVELAEPTVPSTDDGPHDSARGFRHQEQRGTMVYCRLDFFQAVGGAEYGIAGLLP